MDNSNLAKRMKEYEKNSNIKLMKRTPVAIRLDMRAGHTFTKGFEHPFDKIFMESMQETMKYLCENIGNAVIGYCQSDEITIIMIDYKNLNTECFFDNRVQKLCSISASMATLAFNKIFSDKTADYILEHRTNLVPQDVKRNEYIHSLRNAVRKGAMFDARCFNIPKEEVINLILWRIFDCERNSIQMCGQVNFSHKELQNKACKNIKEMLLEKNFNWEALSCNQKFGTLYLKDKELIGVSEKTYNYLANLLDSYIYIGEEN